MNNFVTLAPASCRVLNSDQIRFCLPEKEICLSQPTDGILSECGQSWNCTKCAADSEYLIPFIRNDKIQILTRMYDGYNADPENPVHGWGTFIRAEFMGDVSGTITNLAAFTSRKMVAWGCDQSYQILEVDTSLFPDCIFSIQITTYNTSGDIIEQVCTQEYGEVNSKAKVVMLTGNNTKKDCFGGCYEAPDAYVGDLIMYDNSIRLHGYIKASDISKESIVVQGTTTRTEFEDQYIFQLGAPIPPFMHRVLMRQIMAGSTVTIDGETYDVPESLSSSNDLDRGYMFLYSLTLTKECAPGSGGNCN
ncbi:MAG: hypothetical protein ACWA44_02425 [Thiotrichales bacterium]